MRLRAATKQKERHQKKVQFNQSAKKVVTNDSIGTFSPGLYILYFLKLPAPPRADLSGIIYGHGFRGELRYCFAWLVPVHRNCCCRDAEGASQSQSSERNQSSQGQAPHECPIASQKNWGYKGFEIHAGIEHASVTEGPSCYTACGRWMGLAWKWNRQAVGPQEMQMERINIHQNTIRWFLTHSLNYILYILYKSI